MFVSNISKKSISFFSIRKHQKRVKAMKIMKIMVSVSMSIPRPSAATTSVMKICGHGAWRKKGNTIYTKRYGKPFTRIMNCFSVSIQLVSLPSTRLPMDDALPRPRCARAENSGRPDEMPCSSAPLVILCQTKPAMVVTSPLHHGFIVLLTIDLSVSMDWFQGQSPGKPWFSHVFPMKYRALQIFP